MEVVYVLVCSFLTFMSLNFPLRKKFISCSCTRGVIRKVSSNLRWYERAPLARLARFAAKSNKRIPPSAPSNKACCAGYVCLDPGSQLSTPHEIIAWWHWWITYQQMKGESYVKLGKIVKSTPCKVMVDLPNCMFQFKKDEPEQGKNWP